MNRIEPFAGGDSVFGLFIISCSLKLDLTNNEFPEEKVEVLETVVGIVQSLKDGVMYKLTSIHCANSFAHPYQKFN